MVTLFFSPESAETACGMFTLPHIISLILCLIFIGIAVYFSRNLSDTALKKITRILAYVFTAMEIIKIIYKIAHGYTDKLDYFLPISFCSLFIYCLWLCGFGKGIAYRIGSAFIVCGCFTGGLAFLFVPATSLMMHPVYHYLSIHSMLFHSAMVYLSIVYIIKAVLPIFNKNVFYTYCSFVLLASIIAIMLNILTGSNLMLLTFPVNIPIGIINTVAESIPALYTAGAVALYVILPYGVAVLMEKLITRLKNKASDKEVIP